MDTTTAAASTTARKSLRHSALRALGPVRAKVTAHPRASRFAGRGLYACLELESQPGVSFALECDGNVAEDLRALPLDTWVTLVALGRDGAATVQRMDAPAATASTLDITRAADMAVELVDALRARIGREPTAAEAVAFTVLMASRF